MILDFPELIRRRSKLIDFFNSPHQDALKKNSKINTLRLTPTGHSYLSKVSTALSQEEYQILKDYYMGVAISGSQPRYRKFISIREKVLSHLFPENIYTV
jgi:hypothetical protein